MEYWKLFLLCLAAARLTRMMVQEHGPMNVFGVMRRISGAEKRPLRNGSFADMYNCPWCMSVYWVAMLYGLRAVFPVAVDAVCLFLAMTYAAGFAVKQAAIR